MSESELQRLIKAAQAHDLAHRPRGQNWGRVPDDQVARLITGALGEQQAASDRLGRVVEIALQGGQDGESVRHELIVQLDAWGMLPGGAT